MKTRQPLRICIFSKAMAAHRGGNFLWPFTLIARQLRELGHDVIVLTTAHPDSETTTTFEDNVEVHYLSGTKPEKTSKEYWLASARLFDRLHSSRPFDLVMGRGRSSWGFVSESRYSDEVPLISHEGTYPSWLHTYKVKAARITGPLKWAHAVADATSHRKLAACLLHSDLVIGNSGALADAISESFWWDPPATRFIPYAFSNPQHPSAPVPDALQSWCAEGSYIVYVGRVTRRKGALDLLRVLHGCSNRKLRLLICGEANRNNMQRVTHLAGKLGIANRIHLAGPVFHAALPSILAGARAFLFPSTHPESLPKSVMEAMAAGLPVLAYNIPALSELICNGRDGFLAGPGDLKTLTSHLDQILGDEALREKIGAAARDRIAKEFNPQQISMAWEDALQTYAAGKRQVAPTYYSYGAGQLA